MGSVLGTIGLVVLIVLAGGLLLFLGYFFGLKLLVRLIFNAFQRKK